MYTVILRNRAPGRTRGWIKSGYLWKNVTFWMIWIGRRAFFACEKKSAIIVAEKTSYFSATRATNGQISLQTAIDAEKMADFSASQARQGTRWFFCVASTTGHKVMLRASRHYFSKAQINKNPYGWCIALPFKFTRVLHEIVWFM